MFFWTSRSEWESPLLPTPRETFHKYGHLFICEFRHYAMEKKPTKAVKMLLEQIALTAMFFTLGKSFFWRSINNNALEWFLLIICTERTPTRYIILLGRNHPKLCFWLRRECRQTCSTEQFLHRANKNSHKRKAVTKIRKAIRKAVLKISQYSQENACVGVSF